MNITNKDQWQNFFFLACRSGNLEDIKRLTQDSMYLNKGWANVNAGQDWGCYLACLEGHLDVVKYLLTSPELKASGHQFANVRADSNSNFEAVCSVGHLEIVKYLLTSKELIDAGHEFADLHAAEDSGFCEACSEGQLEVVKYLLTSPELIEAGHTFADVHASSDYGFYRACEEKHWNVIQWLVIDYGIDKTPKIEEIIKEYPQAKGYFQVREEMQDMKKTLVEPEVQKDERAPKKAKKL